MSHRTFYSTKTVDVDKKLTRETSNGSPKKVLNTSPKTSPKASPKASPKNKMPFKQAQFVHRKITKTPSISCETLGINSLKSNQDSRNVDLKHSLTEQQTLKIKQQHSGHIRNQNSQMKLSYHNDADNIDLRERDRSLT